MSPRQFKIIIISGLVGNWLFAIGRNSLGSNYESTRAISSTVKLAVRTIKSAAPSDICLTRLNLGTEPFSYRHRHAIDSSWCSTDNLEHVTIQVEHRACCWWPSIRTFKLDSFSSYFSYDVSIRNFSIVLIYFLLRMTSFSFSIGKRETIISSPAIQPVGLSVYLQHAETSIYLYFRSINLHVVHSVADFHTRSLNFNVNLGYLWPT
jgi:hypothetical protein